MHKYSFAQTYNNWLNKNSLRLFWICMTFFAAPHSSFAQTLQQQYQNFFSNYYLSNIPLIGAGKIIASSTGKELISSGDTIYVSETEKSPNYYIFSYVTSIPYDNGKYDYIFKRLGKAQFDADYQGTLIMHILNITQEINLGDQVVPSDFVNTQLPEKELSADTNITGKVIQMEGAADYAGTYQSVLINSGQSNGLKIGMRVYFESPARKIDGYAVPGLYLGQGFIYRLAHHHAIALITNAKQEIMTDSRVITQRSNHHVKQ